MLNQRTLAGTAVLATSLLASLPAQAQSTDQIRAEINALRQSYESRIAELESRLAKLETETNATFDEIYSPKFFEEGLPKNVTRNFELHGYLRAGYAINSDGQGNEEFVIPDGLFEIGWRLGNEKDAYGELTSVYHFPMDEDAAQFKFVNTLAYKYNTTKSNYTTDADADIMIREAYIQATNVFKGSPDMSFWAGQRFYDRHDIHINDFYFLDMSGWGGGVEGIDVGFGKLAVAWLGGTRDDLVVSGKGSLTENHLDLRIRDIDVLAGKGMLWVDLMRTNGGAGVNPDDESGWAVGWVQFNPLESGFNKFSIMYGDGAAADFNTYIGDWKPKGALNNADRLLITEQLVWQFTEKVSLMAAAVMDRDELGWDPTGPGNDSDGERTLYSLGVRPMFMLTDHFGLQFETGVDYVDDVRWTGNKDSGYLGKFTFAPTIRPTGAFFVRPEIRLFASYFFWDDDLPLWFGGQGVDAGDTDAWTFGIQAETWW